MTNYLEFEIGEVRDEIHRLSKCLPGLSGEDADWAIQGVREELEKFRGLVERRTKYVTIRRLIDVTCERCGKGEERDEQGHHIVTCGVGDPSLPMKMGALRCLASGLWDELAKIEKENADATE